jgi:hypothetical protein
MTRSHEILAVVLLSTAPAAASPAPEHAPPPGPATARQLSQLRGELIFAGRDKALAELPRFRPLCDRDGYPLVGNLASKGDRYQPSQFCSDVRAREKRS